MEWTVVFDAEEHVESLPVRERPLFCFPFCNEGDDGRVDIRGVDAFWRGKEREYPLVFPAVSHSHVLTKDESWAFVIPCKGDVQVQMGVSTGFVLKLLFRLPIRSVMESAVVGTGRRRLAVSFAFVEVRADGDWGDAWVWDMDDASHPTVSWLGCVSRESARWYAESHGYLFYGQPFD